MSGSTSWLTGRLLIISCAVFNLLFSVRRTDFCSPLCIRFSVFSRQTAIKSAADDFSALQKRQTTVSAPVHTLWNFVHWYIFSKSRLQAAITPRLLELANKAAAHTVGFHFALPLSCAILVPEIKVSTLHST